MAPIVVSTEVNRPAAQVFTYATDPTRFPEWQKGVVDGHMDQSGPTDRGPMLHHPADRLRGAAGHLRARPHRPAQDLGGAVDGPIRAKVDVRVEALTDTRSRLTISVDFDGHGIGKVLVPLAVRRQARKEMPANVAMLKRRLETPQSTVRGAGIGE